MAFNDSVALVLGFQCIDDGFYSREWHGLSGSGFM